MQTVEITDHRSHAATIATRGSRISTIARIATIVMATVFVAVVIAWIVAASLGLGADGRRGIGPDRPPAPDLFRWTASGPTLPRGAMAWKAGL